MFVTTTSETDPEAKSEDLPPGTTPYYARMHRYIKRAVLVCLVALVSRRVRLFGR